MDCMSNWNQVGDNVYSTPVRATTVSVIITPTPHRNNHNYYSHLLDNDYDSEFSYSTFLPAAEVWEDEAIFWEGVRCKVLQNTSELEEEVTFTSCSSASVSIGPYPDSSDSEDTTSSDNDSIYLEDTMGKTDYKDIA